MRESLLFYITVTAIIALLVALFQYKPWRKSATFLWVLTTFRAISIGALLLLILNPKTDLNSSLIVKPKLSILVDNTQSIQFLNRTELLNSTLKKLSENGLLNEKFEIQSYKFDKDFTLLDSLEYTGTQTNIGKSLETINAIHKDDQAAVVLLSDGNQTIGNSYLYQSKFLSQAVFPVVIGDTTPYVDLKIQQLNVNKYTFLGNTFPVEIFVNYNGSRSIQTNLKIYSGASLLFDKLLQLSPESNSMSTIAYLKAKRIGLQRFRAVLSTLTEEKLTTNNSVEFGIEVIDQQIKIALISESSHPDLGAFKAMLETQNNYEIELLSPEKFLNNASAYTVAVLYQPNNRFKSAYEAIEKYNINTFTIGGTFTDWSFLNDIQSNFNQEATTQKEVYQGASNQNFEDFALEPINFENYPPLATVFGSTTLKGQHNILIFKTVNNINTQQPMLFSYSNTGKRHVVLLAEDIWKWRMYCYRQHQSFKKIDNFFRSIFQYLSTQKSTNRLKVSHASIFDGSERIAVYAQFFGENFEFNSNADMEIEIKSKNLKKPLIFPMLIENRTYVANLESLQPGSYSYKVRLRNKQFSTAGRFEILPFSIEKQFLNANLTQLQQLALQTNGQLFYENTVDNLISKLLANEQYKSIQKVEKKSVPLIHFKLLLLLLLLSLASEWFIRKYFGLI
tara:strand:- start:27688 stop:29718 length:2031 start_codon:yes stop_codon:yes gene_type:complete